MAPRSLGSHNITQSSRDLHGASPRHPRTGDDHDIYILVQQTPRVPKPLPHRTLDPIPHDRVPHLAAHCHPQPPHGNTLCAPRCSLASPNPCRSNQHHKLTRCQPPPQPRDAHEISTGPESLPAPQVISLAHYTALLGPNSHSHSLPPLGTPPLDDRLSPAGLHPQPKPVRPQPFDSTGLIGSLHLPTFPLPKAFCQRNSTTHRRASTSFAAPAHSGLTAEPHPQHRTMH